jgi:hypothetical protein
MKEDWEDDLMGTEKTRKKHNTRRNAILSGAFGGIFTVLLPFSYALTNKTANVTADGLLGMIIGLIVIATLGAGLAFVTKETDLYKAFLIGMSLPSFLNATGQFVSNSRLPGNTATQNTSTTEVRINNNSGGWGKEFLDLFFVKSAFAQEPASKNRQSLAIHFDESASDLTIRSVMFFDSTGHELGGCSDGPIKRGDNCLIPNGARRIKVTIKDVQKPFMMDLDSKKVHYDIYFSKKKAFFDGLWSVFGVDRATIIMRQK